VWDLWMLVKDLDPRVVAINYDIGHATVRGGPGWYDTAHAVREHLRGVSVKDFQWVHFPVRPFSGRWSPKFCRPGDGIVDFLGFFQYLAKIGYGGAIQLYFEYETYTANLTPVSLLGTDYGRWKLEVPQEQLLGCMKRDLDFYRNLIQEAQSPSVASRS